MNSENEYYFKYLQKCEELEILYSECCEHKERCHKQEIELNKLRTTVTKLQAQLFDRTFDNEN